MTAGTVARRRQVGLSWEGLFVAKGQLYRSRNGYVAGVCAGIAERHDLDAIVVRVFAVLLAGVTLGLGIILYIVMWVYVPLQPGGLEPYDVMPASAESSAYGDTLSAVSGARAAYGEGRDRSGDIPVLARLAVAVALMLLFLAVSIGIAPMFSGSQWWQFWPLLPLIAGLCLIVIPARTSHEALWHALGIVLTSVSAMMLPMALGVVSWMTLADALGQLWPLLVLSVVLFIAGVYRGTGALVIVAGFCIVVFCAWVSILILLMSFLIKETACLSTPLTLPSLAMR